MSQVFIKILLTFWALLTISVASGLSVLGDAGLTEQGIALQAFIWFDRNLKANIALYLLDHIFPFNDIVATEFDYRCRQVLKLFVDFVHVNLSIQMLDFH